MKLSTDSQRFLALLNAVSVRYLLTGGHAVVYHGCRRDVNDLDVWVPREREVAEKLVQVLRTHGVNDQTLTPQMILAHDLVRIGRRPFAVRQEGDVLTIGASPFRTELLFWTSGGAFEDCYQRRVRAAIDGLDVNVIGLEDLIITKTASKRTVDREDLKRLSELQEEK
jgi:hypothetical protein